MLAAYEVNDRPLTSDYMIWVTFFCLYQSVNTRAAWHTTYWGGKSLFRLELNNEHWLILIHVAH
jgi:hypothetical protein